VIARLMRADLRTTTRLGHNSLLSSLSSLNPGTTDARLLGQGRHEGRSQDADDGDAMGPGRVDGMRPNHPA